MPSSCLIPSGSGTGCCGCCCGLSFSGRLCKLLCCSISVRRSIVTRLLYSAGFLLVGAIALGFHFSNPDLPLSLTPASALANCTSRACFALLGAFRVILANALYHALHMILLVGVKSTRDPRAYIQNSGWLIKAAVLAAIMVGLFYVPASALTAAPVVSMVFATFFLFLQTFLLVDFAHSFAEKCISKHEETSGMIWKCALIGGSVACYSVMFAGTVLLYVALAPNATSSATTHPCWANQALISVHLLLTLVHTVLCVHPRIREANPRSGLFQSAIIAVYTSYLLVSALATDPFGCTAGGSSLLPGSHSSASLSSGSSALARAATIAGVVLSMLSLAYSALDTASNDFFLPPPLTASQTVGCAAAVVDGSTEGVLDDAASVLNDEANATAYSYSYFHTIFALATFYLGVIITGWVASVDDAAAVGAVSGLGAAETAGVAPAVWVKLGSAGVVIVLYCWTLLAPLVLPNRDFT
ncbi:serine incorporator/TMS membrane protein [Blastocladiella britannica]|nr:serine incorporator/TMS membrane protein [Blastocladiella britannica]